MISSIKKLFYVLPLCIFVNAYSSQLLPRELDDKTKRHKIVKLMFQKGGYRAPGSDKFDEEAFDKVSDPFGEDWYLPRHMAFMEYDEIVKGCSPSNITEKDFGQFAPELTWTFAYDARAVVAERKRAHLKQLIDTYKKEVEEAHQKAYHAQQDELIKKRESPMKDFFTKKDEEHTKFLSKTKALISPQEKHEVLLARESALARASWENKINTSTRESIDNNKPSWWGRF